MSLITRDNGDNDNIEQRIDEALENLPVEAGVQNTAEERLLNAREKLKVKSSLLAKAKKGFSATALILNLLVALTVLGIGGYGFYAYNNGEFYASRAVDERACRVKLSEDNYLMGRRYYSYRYTEIFGYRLVDTKGITERTELFLDSFEFIVIGHRKDGSFWKEEWPKGVPGVLPLDEAVTYTVFTGKVAGSATYDGFCKQFNKTHPFATLN